MWWHDGLYDRYCRIVWHWRYHTTPWRVPSTKARKQQMGLLYPVGALQPNLSSSLARSCDAGDYCFIHLQSKSCRGFGVIRFNMVQLCCVMQCCSFQCQWLAQFLHSIIAQLHAEKLYEKLSDGASDHWKIFLSTCHQSTLFSVFSSIPISPISSEKMSTTTRLEWDHWAQRAFPWSDSCGFLSRQMHMFGEKTWILSKGILNTLW